MRKARRPCLQLTLEQDRAIGEILRSFPIDELQPELRRLWCRLGPGLSEGCGGKAFLDRLKELAREEARARKRDSRNRSPSEKREHRAQRDTALGKLVDALHRAGMLFHDSRKSEAGAYEVAATRLGASAGTAKRAHDRYRKLFQAFDYVRDPPQSIVGKGRAKLSGEK